MEGDVDTIRALVKGEAGRGCKTTEVFLPAGKDEVSRVLSLPGETLVLFINTAGGGETEREFVFLMLVKSVGKAVSVL